MSSLNSSAPVCPVCGCEGLHSCLGAPVVGTPEQDANLRRVLDCIFSSPQEVGPGPQITEIFVDLDGVLVDFYAEAAAQIGQPYRAVSGARAWGILDQVPRLFRDLAPTPDAMDLWSGVNACADGEGARVAVLSALPMLTNELMTAPDDKRAWVEQHLGPAVSVNLVPGGVLKARFAHPSAVLIDDLDRNIIAWRAAGGIGILHRSAEETLTCLGMLIRRQRGFSHFLTGRTFV